jgi:hypothetical protein
LLATCLWSELSRNDWEGDCVDAKEFTDFFSHLTPEIIRAYPEVKVVVAQREFDFWWLTYRNIA